MTRKPLVFGHKLDTYGCRPHSVHKSVSENENLFPFVYAFTTQDSLWSKLVNVSSEEGHIQTLRDILHKLSLKIRFCNNQNLPWALVKLRECFDALLQTEIDPLIQLCAKLEGCKVIKCTRVDVLNVSIDCSRFDVLLIVSTGSQGRDPQIPFKIALTNGTVFYLAFTAKNGQLSRKTWPSFLWLLDC